MSCNSGNVKLDDVVNNWLKLDKNPKTRKEVLDDIENARWDKLNSTMLQRLKFGTAGLRGPMTAGYKAMNDVVVLQTAQGLCSYVKKVCNQSQLHNGVVIGFDGRYNSKRFAELTAKVFISSSIPVHIFSSVCATPLVSFGTILYGAAAGVMVTASHNPKEDNGYKVYWGNGSQIITPHDDNILEEIEQCLDIPEDHWNIEEIWAHELVKNCQDEVTNKYMETIIRPSPDILQTNKSAAIDIVYSAMHGVGYEYILKAFKTANLKAPISVKEQEDPNPEFPTVVFPNPEEPQCLQRARRCAERHRARLVLVNDPDADRLAVAESRHGSKSWYIFSGNEMGALLGWWLLQQHSKKNPDSKEVYMIASIVSSKMLRAIVKGKGEFVETLTGFKWMGNTSLLLAQEGKLPLFAFEEAIGYMCDHRVPDKDGISAAVQVGSLASHLYSEGSSLLQQLHSLYCQYQYHVTHNGYYICHQQPTIQKIFRRIRNYHAPGEYPKTVGSCEIVYLKDYTAGVTIPEHVNGETHHLKVLGTGLEQDYTSGEMVQFRSSNGLSLTVRTSGTEPKIKYYSELVCDAPTTSEQDAMNLKFKEMVREIVEELLQPQENGLIG